MQPHSHTSIHTLSGLVAIAFAVTGVFSFSTGLSAHTERLIAEVSAAEPPTELFIEIASEPEKEPPAPRSYLTLAAPTVETLILPIADAANRITKKPFGIEIHPETSPVPNDHFNGFHVGVDFEMFADEQDSPVPVYAICPGPLLFKKLATGYGGVAVQGCRLRGQDVSVIYGHLSLESITAVSGEQLVPGRRIGDLGKGYSEETDGVRKHLHLGIRKGRTLDIRGYVKDAAEMSEFIDVRKYLGLVESKEQKTE